MSLDIGKVVIALGALLAYKNKDKIGDMLRGNPDPNNPQAPRTNDGGILDTGAIGTGLQDILDRFRGAGAGPKVDSWVGKGANEPLQPKEVESAVTPEVLDELQRQTGLSRKELIDRITRDLPDTVNELTPDGRLPDVAAGKPKDGELLDNVWTKPANQA